MRLLVLTIVTLALAGCRERVQVVDPAGKPIPNAQVAPVSPSMNGAAAKTDERGEALVPLRVSLQETKWVNVSKPGYESRQVPVPAKWPLKVVLKPSKPGNGG